MITDPENLVLVYLRRMDRKLDSVIETFLKIKEDVWIVDSASTTRELSESLGIRSGEIGTGVIVLIGSYSGRTRADVWEWLDLHRSRDG